MPPLYLCIHLRDFAAQVLTGWHGPAHGAANGAADGAAKGTANYISRSAAVAVLSGDPPLERVFALNREARRLRLEVGMSRIQAESFPTALLRRNRHQEELAFAELTRCAQRFSPRVEILATPQENTCGATLRLDISGSERLLGSPRQIASAVWRTLCALVCGASCEKSCEADCQTSGEASVAVSHNACAALLAARGTPGIVAIACGREAETLAPLPLSVLDPGDELAQTFAAWGIHTLGQLAALPTRPLAARLGQNGLHLQAQARAEYRHLLLPAEEPADAPLCESMDIEHPVELLEPLLFLLNQMLEQVTERAAQRSLAIASVELCLVVEKNDRRAEDPRTIRPALPERDRHILLKLLQLELELHPPAAAVVALRITAHPARPQTAQPGLFAAQAPEPGRLEILLARLRKLVGEDRAGSPELLDSHASEAFRMVHFDPGIGEQSEERLRAELRGPLRPALRMLRPPCAVAMELRGNAPVAMQYEGERHIVQTSSGPWRSSGAWWTHSAWCREEWDVVLDNDVRNAPQVVPQARGGHGTTDGSASGTRQQIPLRPQAPPDAGRCLRLAHDPASGGWYVIGIYD